MCSNISTETTRSNLALRRERIHVGGDDVEIGQPFRMRLRLMKARCEREFDTDVIRAAG